MKTVELGIAVLYVHTCGYGEEIYIANNGILRLQVIRGFKK